MDGGKTESKTMRGDDDSDVISITVIFFNPPPGCREFTSLLPLLVHNIRLYPSSCDLVGAQVHSHSLMSLTLEVRCHCVGLGTWSHVTTCD